MDKLVVIIFVAIGVLALVLGCVLMIGMINDMATDFSGQVYSTAEPSEAAVTEHRTEPTVDKDGEENFVLDQNIFFS